MPVFKRGALLGLALFALSQILEAVGYSLSGTGGAPSSSVARPCSSSSYSEGSLFVSALGR